MTTSKQKAQLAMIETKNAATVRISRQKSAARSVNGDVRKSVEYIQKKKKAAA